MTETDPAFLNAAIRALNQFQWGRHPYITVQKRSLLNTAIRAVKQFQWGRHSDVVVKETSLTVPESNVFAGLKYIREQIARKDGDQAIFLLGYDPYKQKPIDLKIWSWPGQTEDLVHTERVRKTIIQAIGLMKGIGYDLRLSEVLNKHGMGPFPAFIVCPSSGSRFTGTYDRAYNGTCCQVEGSFQEPMTMVHEWGHQLLQLTGAPILGSSRQDLMLYHALDEAHSWTLQYISGYIAYLNGQPEYLKSYGKRWDLVAPPPIRKLLDAASTIPDLEEKIKQGDIPQEFFQALFKAHALDPTYGHLSLYHDDALRELPAGGLTVSDETLSTHMPFGKDPTLIKAIREADFLLLLDQSPDGKCLVQNLKTTREEARVKKEEARVLEAFNRFQEIRGSKAGDKEAGQLCAAYLEIWESIAHYRPSDPDYDIPVSVVETLGFLDPAAFIGFLNDLKPEAKQDAIDHLRTVDSENLYDYGVDQREGLFNQRSILTCSDIETNGLTEIAVFLDLWNSFDFYRKDGGESSIRDLATRLFERKATISFFQSSDDRRTPSEFARDIGLYDAIEAAEAFQIKCRRTPSWSSEEVLAHLGIDSYPTEQPSCPEKPPSKMKAGISIGGGVATAECG